jgi:hypothetical protein
MRGLVTAVLALLGFYAAVVAVALALFALVPPRWTRGAPGLAVTSVPTVLAALAISALLVRAGVSRWATLGWRGTRHGLRWFAAGVAAGLAMAAAALVLTVVAGEARITVTREPTGAYPGAALNVGLVLAVAALAEELVFRGYPLARLARGAGKVGASVALAAVFVGPHAWNPNASAIGLANIALASLVLSAAFFGPSGLPVAWGVHFGWNGGLSLGADAPVSGVAFGLPVLEFTAGGPAWWTGGAFGPEAGVAATLVMAAALAGFVRLAGEGPAPPESGGGARA